MGFDYTGAVRAELARTLSEYLQEVSQGRHENTVPGATEGNGPADGTSLVEGSGIINCFRSRKEALRYFNPKLDRAQRVIVIGSSLKELIHPDTGNSSTREILRRRVSVQRANGTGPTVTTDFVLTHPAFADLRASQEDRAKQDIAQEIFESLIYLEEWEALPGIVHLYLGTPTCFGVLADDQMILNPYAYADVAFQSPCLLLQDGGYFFNTFVNSHFGILDRTMVVRLSDLPADIGDLHWDLSEFQRRTDDFLKFAKESTTRDQPPSHTEGDLEKHPGFGDIVARARKRHEDGGRTPNTPSRDAR
jgi:hypothetical protein